MSTEKILHHAKLVAGAELRAADEDESLERKLFRLALALAAEPSKLVYLRRMLVHQQEQRAFPEDFAIWALEQIDERVQSMALEYAHDAEILVQILSFTGGTFADLTQDIEKLYQHGLISPRVYVKARLMLKGQDDVNSSAQ